MEITKEEIIGLINKEELANSIADKIYKNSKDFEDEFNKELLKGMEVAVKRIVDEYLVDYYEKSSVENLVKERLENLSKKDLINIISNK